VLACDESSPRGFKVLPGHVDPRAVEQRPDGARQSPSVDSVWGWGGAFSYPGWFNVGVAALTRLRARCV